MCAVVVIIAGGLALTLIVSLARFSARHNDALAALQRALRDIPAAPECDVGDHDPERADRDYITVAELQERRRNGKPPDATLQFPVTRRRPSPLARGGQR